MVVNKAPDAAPENLGIALDLGQKTSVTLGSAYKTTMGVRHDAEFLIVVDKRNMSPTENDFTLICKLYLLKVEKELLKAEKNADRIEQFKIKKKLGESIRDDLERGATLGEKGIKELIQKYQRSWDNLKIHWGSSNMSSKVLEQLTSDHSPGREKVRAGFNPEYHQLLYLIQELHMELYPNPHDLHTPENKFLPPVSSKKPSY